MARQLRIEFSGACYHVFNRGVERRVVFADQADYGHFLDLIRELKGPSRVELHAYCLMPNHYHLMIRTPEGGLKPFMQSLSSRYAMYFNRRFNRVGPLFQGRYRALVVQTDLRVRTLIRYVHRNPVMAGLCEKPEAWPWSSCGWYLGTVEGDPPIERSLVYALHGENTDAARQLMKLELDRPGHEEQEWQRAVKGGLISGTDSFVRRLQRDLIPTRADGTVSRLRDLRRPPEQVVNALRHRISRVARSLRDEKPFLVYALRRSTSFTAREVARLAGLPSATAVGQVIWRIKARRSREADYAAALGRLDAVLRGGKP